MGDMRDVWEWGVVACAVCDGAGSSRLGGIRSCSSGINGFSASHSRIFPAATTACSRIPSSLSLNSSTSVVSADDAPTGGASAPSSQ